MGPITDAIVTTDSGLTLLSVCRELGLKAANAFFGMLKHNRLTWYHSKSKEAMLDLIQAKPSPEVEITDIRASTGVDINSNHCLVTPILKKLMPHLAEKEIIAEKQDGCPGNLGQVQTELEIIKKHIKRA